jgi:squalene-hopene/tetraprenyl-beta-curcumene cyclase
MRTVSLSLALLTTAIPAVAETNVPAPTKPDEPIAKSFSPAKAAAYIDGVSLAWTRTRDCATCHTNVPFMLARPKVKGGDPEPMKEVRKFLEERVQSWEKDKPFADYDVVATAYALAANDAATTGKLHPATRAALDRMWTLQKPNGSWKWPACDWPPLEHDQFFSVVFVSIAVALAPDNYKDSPAARAGLDNIRKYLKANPIPELHHKASLLWAATKIDGLLSDEERKATITELRNLQLADGGWNLPALGPYPMRRDKKTPNDMTVSDGFATGFVTFVLRQAGVPATDPALVKSIAWLKANQRESGRWFTQSPGGSKAHYVTNVGSAFAILALDACGEKLVAE